MAEHVLHLGVLGKGDGAELGDSPRAGDRGELVQQHRGEALPLVRVLDDECHLGRARVRCAVIAGDANDLAVEKCNQCVASFVVDVHEAIQHLGT